MNLSSILFSNCFFAAVMLTHVDTLYSQAICECVVSCVSYGEHGTSSASGPAMRQETGYTLPDVFRRLFPAAEVQADCKGDRARYDFRIVCTAALHDECLWQQMERYCRMELGRSVTRSMKQWECIVLSNSGKLPPCSSEASALIRQVNDEVTVYCGTMDVLSRKFAEWYGVVLHVDTALSHQYVFHRKTTWQELLADLELRYGLEWQKSSCPVWQFKISCDDQ